MSNHKSRLGIVIFIAVGIALFPLLSTPTPVAADGTVTDCHDDQQFSSFLPQGGTIFFNCGITHTITVSSEKVITTSVWISGTNGGFPIVLSGGGVRRIFSISGVTVHLFDMTVTNGRAQFDDGGNILSTGTLYLTDVTVSHGQATTSGSNGGKGGGIYNSGSLIIRSSTISGNTATDFGSLSGSGGGIYSTGRMDIINSTISGNNADNQGGGIFSSGAASRLLNSTVVSNTAFTDGANLTATGSLSLKNTILAGGGGTNCSSTTTFSSLGHNLSDDTSCTSLTAGGDLTNTLASLGTLANNGGKTMTHALLPGSPAIDAGDNSGCPGTDQRGVLRPLDGNGDSVAVCDIGSYEYLRFRLFLPLIRR